MNKVREGTFRYLYPWSTWPKKVRLGTPPFRGVPGVPKQSQVAGSQWND